ncbi:hypothetical protein D3C75_1313320 [compost metagenome]
MKPQPPVHIAYPIAYLSGLPAVDFCLSRFLLQLFMDSLETLRFHAVPIVSHLEITVVSRQPAPHLNQSGMA